MKVPFLCALRGTLRFVSITSMAFAAVCAHAKENLVIPFYQGAELSLAGEWKSDCKGVGLWNAKALPRKDELGLAALYVYFQTANEGKLRAHLDGLAADGTRQKTAGSIPDEASLRAAFRNLQAATCAGSLKVSNALAFHLIDHKVKLPAAEGFVETNIVMPIATRCDGISCKVSSQFRKVSLVSRLVELAGRAGNGSSSSAQKQGLKSAKQVLLSWRPYHEDATLISGTWSLLETTQLPQRVQLELRRMAGVFQNARNDAGAAEFRELFSAAYVSLRSGVGKSPASVSVGDLLESAKRMQRFEILGVSPASEDPSRFLVFVAITSDGAGASIEAWPFACGKDTCRVVPVDSEPDFSIADLFTFGGM